MKIGFSGSRNGMTQFQKNKFNELMDSYKPTEFHHGCCFGADIEAHYSVVAWISKVVAHPPEIMTLAQIPSGCEVRPHRPYLKRNHHIVDETDLLIATPSGESTSRSGTWSALRYAHKKNKNYIIIYPNGSCGGMTFGV